MKKSNCWASALVAAATALTGASAFGQVMSETCSGLDTSPANSIVAGTAVTGNFTGSTNDGATHASTCGEESGNLTQWWLFIPSATTTYTISMCGSAQSDTIVGLELASAACTGTGVVWLACNDDGCGLGSQIVASLTSGVAYRIRASTFGSVSNGGGYTILVTQQSATPPSGDDCASPISASNGNNAGTLVGATGSIASGGNSCGGTTDQNDVYFSYMATVTGAHKFSVCTGDFDAVLSVHTACPVDGTTTNQIASACATSADTATQCGGRGAFLSVSLTSGTTYLVRVAGTSDQGSTSVGQPFVGFGSFNLVIAQPPPAPANDTCATAVDLTMALPYSAAVVNENAGNDIDPGTCNTGTSGWGGVWYTYTPAASGVLGYSETSGQDVCWGIWASGACDPVGTPTCNTTDASNTIAVTAGTTYKIQCGATSSSTSRTTPLAVAFEFISPPANDTCGTATALTTFPTAFNTDVRAATDDTLNPTCDSSATLFRKSIWWSFTPGSNGSLTFSETSSNDTATAVFTGTCGALTQVGCSDPESSSFPLTAGTTYYIGLAMWSSSTNPTVNFTGTIDFVSPPDNDTCGTATNIPTLPATVTASRSAAANDETFDVTCNSGTTFRKAVWYTVTPADSGSLAVTQLSSNDTAVAIFTGTCGALTEVGCSDPNAAVFAVTGGTTYYIGVGMWGTSTTPTSEYSLSLELITPPDNDDCDTPTALSLAGGSVTLDGRAAANDTQDVTCNSGTTTVGGVWYSLSTGADGGTLNVNETSTNDTVVAVFTGTCGALTQVGCADAENRNFTLAANTDYLILLGNFSATPTTSYVFTYSFTASTGACCTSGTCSNAVTQSACEGGGGTWQGAGVPCSGPNGTVSTQTAIADGNSGTSTQGTTNIPVTAAGSGTVSTIEVTVAATHSWVGDLAVQLIAPDGSTSAYLFNRVGRASCGTFGTPFGSLNDLAGVYTFIDTASTGFHTAAAANAVLPTGSYLPNDCTGTTVVLNTVFAGQSVAGTWTLRVEDWGGGDTGTIDSWSITINGGVTISCPLPPCPGDFNGTRNVDADDLFDFLDAWFASNPSTPMDMNWDARCDIDGNMAIDADDLFAFLDLWFATNPTTCTP